MNSSIAPSGLLDLRLIESIRSLNSEGRPDLLAELVVIFRETTPVLLDSLEVALQEKNARVVQRLAHRLKGGSGNVGAKHMSRLCSDLETLAREQPDLPSAETSSRASEIRTTFLESATALDALL
ncbi:MAG: Hpt domain-containing protein [Silvanigrellales bacterium]|nr:Hpt domain-containing protein [Silvanigrellales bacterium]